ncbi:hypothetical protein GYMLUDRAFT_581658 [Collybiopsis luxurians FD-317 M1]|uniref:Uncharacterized protein n=1 Tax=Collybiopsis luxurians FD-317 M1 TaxID=944289 RepID=A0A0D0CYD9_9AGAR|nr:hypothetical protein GYMLUDRAFT_581658 [Collybiopsis luxurians FD-317 M1]
MQPIYIGLYEMGRHNTGSGSFHWAIILPRPTENYRLDRSLDIFQIHHPRDEWLGYHRTGQHPALLSHCGKLVGLVELPMLNVSYDRVVQYLFPQPSNQGNTPIFRSRRNLGWSCAQWAIRCLQGMYNLGWFANAPQGLDHHGNWETVFESIRQTGVRFEIYAMNGYSGQVKFVNGVRILL